MPCRSCNKNYSCHTCEHGLKEPLPVLMGTGHPERIQYLEKEFEQTEDILKEMENNFNKGRITIDEWYENGFDKKFDRYLKRIDEVYRALNEEKRIASNNVDCYK